MSSPADELCPHCRQWGAAADDSYCGFCGRLLIQMSVKPEVVTLISGLAPQRILVFSNSSRKPLRIKILPVGRQFRAISFKPDEFNIAPNRKTGVRAHLDGQTLPDNFTAKPVPYRCQIDGDPRKTFPFVVEVKAGPKPHLETPRLEFGGLDEKTIEKRSLKLGNRGGVPLVLKEIQVEGSSQLRAGGNVKLPVKVMPGEHEDIDVLWDTRTEETIKDAEFKGLRLIFGNSDTDLPVDCQAEVYRRTLTIEPREVNRPEVFSRHHQMCRLQLRNAGTVELKISEIAADQDWIEVVSTRDQLVLRPKDNYDLELVFHSLELAAGPHSGKVEFHIASREQPEVLPIHLEVQHPETYHDYIGIDFGTTNSVVAFLNSKSKQAIELVEVDGSPLIPSILVFLSGENSYVMGTQARSEENTRPEKAVRSIKRVMGARNEHEFFGKKFSPEALATLIIRRLIEHAEKRLYAIQGRYFDVRNAIVTVPANFFDLQIRGILEACSAAGIDTEETQVQSAQAQMKKAVGQAVNAGMIIDEPSAAALFYLGDIEGREISQAQDLYQRIDSEKGLHAVVFDHGGGTLDVSLAHVHRLKSGQTGLVVLANRGDNHVGGESIDLKLMDLLLERCRLEIERSEDDVSLEDSLISAPYQQLLARKEREDWDVGRWSDVMAARSEWKNRSEKAKLELSELDVVRFRIEPDGIFCRRNGRIEFATQAFETTVSRDALESASADVLTRCRELLLEVIAVAGIESKDVDYVFHTGRQSLMPRIQQQVRAIFPQLPESHFILDENVKVCVAKGAALYGLVKSGIAAEDAGVKFLDEGRKLPHSYGVEKIVGMTQRAYETVVPKGEAYPCRKVKNYPPSGRRFLNIKIYENTGTQSNIVGNTDVRQIGQINVDTEADGVPGADLVFAIDANRRLQVLVDEQEVKITPEAWEDEGGWNW